jgi:hypothetical protein
VRAHGLPTHFGALDLWLRADGDGVRATLGGACRPPGGVQLVAGPRQLLVRELPAEVELR